MSDDVVSKEVYQEALDKIRELETELYFCYRNKKLSNCNRCNRKDTTCGCANR